MPGGYLQWTIIPSGSLIWNSHGEGAQSSRRITLLAGSKLALRALSKGCDDLRGSSSGIISLTRRHVFFFQKQRASGDLERKDEVPVVGKKVRKTSKTTSLKIPFLEFLQVTLNRQ